MVPFVCAGHAHLRSPPISRLQVSHILLGGSICRVQDGTRTLRVHRGALRGYGRADREDLLLRQ